MQFTSFDYMKTFVQPGPYHIVRFKPEYGWMTRNENLRLCMVDSHLNQRVIYGSLGRWYPEHAIIDIDNRDRKEVDRIRDALGMGLHNSLLCSSQSPDSYHILFIPTYNYKPPTIDLLNTALKPAARKLRFEVYPQKEKCVRLPFGYNQNVLDYDISSWEEAYEYFITLDSYQISETPFDNERQKFNIPHFNGSSTYQEGRSLLETGLMDYSSRHQSQFKVLYCLWRENVDYETAIDTVFYWIMNKHNGYSKTIKNQNIIKNEIARQAYQIWNYYSRIEYYPDSTNNAYYGFITKTDLLRIIEVSNGSLIRMKFLFELVKYCNPRRHRSDGIQVHSKILSIFSDRRVYLKRLEELENIGLITRSRGYRVGKTSKKINLNWTYSDPKNLILTDGRTPETLEDSLIACFTPIQLRKSLIGSGMKSSNVSRFISNIYQNGSTYN